VVRGPAPLSLALAHCDDEGGKVSLRPWTEEDFRTGDKPWWK
jgi:cytochrome b6-f complex iron-sulfur subunit